MSTTQTPPRGPLPPTVPAPEAPGLYDAQHWESAYRHFDEDAVPQLLLHLQDDLTRSRKREAAWLSVIVHLLVIILFVNQPRIEGFYRRVFLHQQPVMSVSVQDLLRQKELTYIELPPDLQKVTKRPDTNAISDKDRTASTRTPQVDPKELKKLMASPRPGTPGTNGPPQPSISEAAPSQQAQNNGGQQAPQQGQPPPQTQNQISQLQPPVQPSPQIKFGGSMSAGSQIDQATRAAAQNRGGYGDGGDFGLNQGARSGAQSQMEVLTDTMGVDFNPYLQRVLQNVKQNWYALIPESAQWKKGRVVLEFFILKDGSVAGLKVVGSSGDVAMDRPAYGSITGSNPFPPLPREFPGPYLGLRFSYYYNLNTDGSEIH
jgi:TonB family protein